jgi:hypothetical protein
MEAESKGWPSADGNDSIQLPCCKPQLLANLGWIHCGPALGNGRNKVGTFGLGKSIFQRSNNLVTQLFHRKKLKSLLAEAILNEFT